jgi:hypothetical protein
MGGGEAVKLLQTSGRGEMDMLFQLHYPDTQWTDGCVNLTENVVVLADRNIPTVEHNVQVHRPSSHSCCISSELHISILSTVPDYW